MIKVVAILINLTLMVGGCTINKKMDGRKDLIYRFISAAARNDTSALYQIVDTNSYFKTQNKENFLFQVDFISKRLQECGLNYRDSLIQIKNVPVNSEQYIIPLCRDTFGDILPNSFDLLFTFTNYDSKEMIHYFDVKRFRGKVIPTTPPPNLK